MLLDNFLEPFANRQEWSYDNKGVSGENTTQIAARFAADVVAQSPQYCMINGGINDIGLGLVTFSQFLINYDTMLASCYSNNIVPIVILITPRTVPGGGDATKSQAADDWNEALRAQCKAATYRNTVRVCDLRPWIAQFRSGGAADNLWDYRPAFSTDGVHLNAAGSVVAGAVIYHRYHRFVGSP